MLLAELYKTSRLLKMLNTTDVPSLETTEEASSGGGGGGGYGGSKHDKSIIPVMFVGCVGIVGNLFVFIVIVKYTQMRKRITTVFILNQTATDLASSLFMTATYAVLYASNYEVSMSGLAGELYCRLWLSGFLVWGCMTCSTYNLLAITSERYMMVVFPIYHKTAFTRQKAYIMVVIVWLVPLGYHAFWNAAYSYVKYGKCLKLAGMPSEIVSKFYGFFSLTIQFFLPLILMTFMYGQMIRILRPKLRARNKVAPQAMTPRGGPPVVVQASHQPGMSRVQLNLTKTLAIVVICYITCWCLNQILWLTVNMGYNFVPLHGPYARATVVLACANSCVNPFIYIFKLEEFKMGVRRMFALRTDKFSEATTMKTNSTASGSRAPSD